MKQVIKTFMGVILFSSIFLISCNKTNNNDNISDIKKEIELLKKEVDSLKSTQNTIEKENTQEENNNLNFLKKVNGKHTWDIKLFENKAFKCRLLKLIGDENYSFLSKYWITEAPMSFSGNIFSAKGCQIHNCNMTNFIIVYDFTNNVMYAGIRKEGNVKTFSEDEGDAPKVQEWRGW